MSLFNYRFDVGRIRSNVDDYNFDEEGTGQKYIEYMENVLHLRERFTEAYDNNNYVESDVFRLCVKIYDDLYKLSSSKYLIIADHRGNQTSEDVSQCVRTEAMIALRHLLDIHHFMLLEIMKKVQGIYEDNQDYYQDLSSWAGRENNTLFEIFFDKYLAVEFDQLISYSTSGARAAFYIGFSGDAQLIDFLVSKGVRFDWYFLNGAVANKNIYALRTLLHLGVLQQPDNWDNWDIEEERPDFMAYLSLNKEMIDIFTVYGANPYVTDRNGAGVLNSILYNNSGKHACLPAYIIEANYAHMKEKTADKIVYVIECGLKCEGLLYSTIVHHETTLLNYAILHHYPPNVIEALIKAGASRDADKRGLTPLMATQKRREFKISFVWSLDCDEIEEILTR